MSQSGNPFLSGLIGGIESFLSRELQNVEATVKQDLADLEVAAVADIKDVFAKGAGFAVTAVSTLVADTTKPGGEKFGLAVTDVMQKLEAELGPVLVQDVQALVQLVVRFGPGIAASLL